MTTSTTRAGIGVTLALALSICAATAVRADAPEKTVLVAPVLSNGLREVLLDDFAKADLYQVGAESTHLVLVEAVPQADFGFLSKSESSMAVTLTLVNHRGRRVAQAEEQVEELTEETLASLYEDLVRAAEDRLAPSGSPRAVNWLEVYDSIYVSKAVNAFARASAEGIPSRDASVYQRHLVHGDDVVAGQALTDAANYQDLVHHFISVGDRRAIEEMLPFVDIYGGDFPIVSNLEYYRENQVFGASAGNLFLHTAAFAGDKDVFDLLYARSPDLGIKNSDGLSPPQIAAAALNFDLYFHIAKLDRNEAARTANDALAWLVLHATELDRQLDSWPDRQYLKADVELSPARLTTFLAELAALGADFDQAWANGHSPLSAAIIAGNAALARALIANGASLDLGAGSDQPSPLVRSIENGHEEMASFLIEQGADIAGNHRQSTTPLVASIRSGMPVVTRLLIARGAPLAVEANNGQSPLVEAIEARQTETVEALLKASADLDSADVVGRTPLLVAMQTEQQAVAVDLVEHGAAVNGANASGQRPIHIAAAMRQMELVASLVGQGANVNALDGDGRTPLHYIYPTGEDALGPADRQAIEQLLDMGADKSIESHAGFTAAGHYDDQRQRFLQEQARIEQARRARAEQLARAERERRQRAEQERQRRLAEQRARSEQRKFQWGKALALGVGFVAGGGAELDAQTQADVLLGIVQDSMAGQSGTSNTTTAVTNATQRYSQASAPVSPVPASVTAPGAPSRAPIRLEPNLLAAAGETCSQNQQVEAMCEVANMYYDRYVEMARSGNVDPTSMYQAHVVSARETMRYIQSARGGASFDTTARETPPTKQVAPARSQPEEPRDDPCPAAMCVEAH